MSNVFDTFFTETVERSMREAFGQGAKKAIERGARPEEVVKKGITAGLFNPDGELMRLVRQNSWALPMVGTALASALQKEGLIERMVPDSFPNASQIRWVLKNAAPGVIIGAAEGFADSFEEGVRQVDQKMAEYKSSDASPRRGKFDELLWVPSLRKLFVPVPEGDSIATYDDGTPKSYDPEYMRAKEHFDQVQLERFDDRNKRDSFKNHVHVLPLYEALNTVERECVGSGIDPAALTRIEQFMKPKNFWTLVNDDGLWMMMLLVERQMSAGQVANIVGEDLIKDVFPGTRDSLELEIKKAQALNTVGGELRRRIGDRTPTQEDMKRALLLVDNVMGGETTNKTQVIKALDWLMGASGDQVDEVVGTVKGVWNRLVDSSAGRRVRRLTSLAGWTHIFLALFGFTLFYIGLIVDPLVPWQKIFGFTVTLLGMATLIGVTLLPQAAISLIPGRLSDNAEGIFKGARSFILFVGTFNLLFLGMELSYGWRVFILMVVPLLAAVALGAYAKAGKWYKIDRFFERQGDKILFLVTATLTILAIGWILSLMGFDPMLVFDNVSLKETVLDTLAAWPALTAMVAFVLLLAGVVWVMNAVNVLDGWTLILAAILTGVVVLSMPHAKLFGLPEDPETADYERSVTTDHGSVETEGELYPDGRVVLNDVEIEEDHRSRRSAHSRPQIVQPRGPSSQDCAQMPLEFRQAAGCR